MGWGLVRRLLIIRRAPLAALVVGLLAISLGSGVGAAAEPPSASPSPSSTAPDDEDEGEADEDAPNWIGVDTLCVGDYESGGRGGSGGEAQINGGVTGVNGRQYAWTLARDGVVIRRESFTYNEADDVTGPHHLDDLAPGTYSLQIRQAAHIEVLSGIDFEMLRCVTAVAGCRSVTFTNPPANPALKVEYGPGEDDESDDEDVHDTGVLILPPGESRTITTLRRVAGWGASRVFRPNQTPSFGGEDYQLGVDQHCGDTVTRGFVGCAVNQKSNAAVDIWFAPPRGQQARFKVLDFHELIDSGPIGGENHLRLRLPPSYYNLRAYTPAAELPYDRADFYVLPCLRVTSTCRGVSFRNQFWSDVHVTYQVDGGRATSIRIRGDQTSELPLPAGATISWRTADRVVEDLAGWQIDAGHGRAVAGQCDRVPGGLAATGVADRSLVGPLLLAGALTVAGLTVLRLDRRRG